jgi:hypothetical protein
MARSVRPSARLRDAVGNRVAAPQDVSLALESAQAAGRCRIGWDASRVMRALGALALVAPVSLIACGEQTPAEVSREYVEAVAEGDGERACNLMTEQFRHETRASDPSRPGSCQESIARFSRLLGDEGREWLREADLSREDAPGSDWAWVRVKGGDQLTLHNRDGEWRVHASIGLDGAD